MGICGTAKLIVEKQQLATKHYHVMPAKKLVYQAMVAMPALFMLGLGFKARTDQDPFEFVCPTPKQNTAILAYANVVRDSAKVPLDPFTAAQARSTRRIAREWVAGADSGELQPLQPVSFDDSMRDGIKSEIMTRNSTTASSILYLAAMEAEDHNWNRAIQDAILGMRVGDVIKYSDYSTVLQGAIYDRRGLKILETAVPHLAPQNRLKLRKDLVFVTPNRDRLHAVVEIERLVFLQYVNRMNPKSTPIETIEPYDGAGFRALAGHFHGELLASAKDDTLPVSRELQRMAEEGEAEDSRLFQQVWAMTDPRAKVKIEPEVVNPPKAHPVMGLPANFDPRKMGPMLGPRESMLHKLEFLRNPAK